MEKLGLRTYKTKPSTESRAIARIYDSNKLVGYTIESTKSGSKKMISIEMINALEENGVALGIELTSDGLIAEPGFDIKSLPKVKLKTVKVEILGLVVATRLRFSDDYKTCGAFGFELIGLKVLERYNNKPEDIKIITLAEMHELVKKDSLGGKLRKSLIAEVSDAMRSIHDDYKSFKLTYAKEMLEAFVIRNIRLKDEAKQCKLKNESDEMVELLEDIKESIENRPLVLNRVYVRPAEDSGTEKEKAKHKKDKEDAQEIVAYELQNISGQTVKLNDIEIKPSQVIVEQADGFEDKLKKSGDYTKIIGIKLSRFKGKQLKAVIPDSIERVIQSEK